MTEPYTLKDFIDDYMRDHPELDSYNKFAQFTGVSASMIGEIVRNGHKPGIDVIGQIADATNFDFLSLVAIVYPERSKQNRPSSARAQLLAQRIEKLPAPVREIIERLIGTYGGDQ